MRKNSAIPSERRKVAVLIQDGLSPFEFGVACEVFGYDRSYLGVPWYEMFVVAPEPGPVRTQLGFTIDAPHGLESLVSAHTVIVPPIEPSPVDPGGGQAAIDARALSALRASHERGARIASLCTGAFLLARAGLLNGRRATTHWTSASRLAQQFPAVHVDPKVLYIDEGDILTSAGSAASIDLCLHMVRMDYGAEIANTVARNLVVQPHRDGGQAQFVEMPLPTYDGTDALFATLQWAQEHLEDDLNVQLLAERSAMSPRTFARRFRSATGTTPHRWLLRQRVQLAQRLLETTDYTVDHVASLCGMGSAANLRLHFDAQLGVAPGAYRRTFARTA
jgi:AraC family transcriptional regulator, transcriptional activator FtrA